MPATNKKQAAAGTMPSPNEAKPIVGWVMPGLDFATFRLGLLRKLMDRKTMRQLCERTGSTYPEWRVIARLGAVVGGSTVGQTAESAWVDRAQVSRAIASLEKRELAARLENPQDRRAPIHCLTQDGSKVYRRMLDMRKSFHGDLVGDLTAEELEQFDAVLLKLARKVHALP